MEFIRKHTTGTWSTFFNGKTGFQNTEWYEIHFSDDGECVAEVVHEKHDALLIAQAPVMIDYMIERAKNLHSFLYSGVLSEKNAKRVYKDEAEELSRILEILKEAGVEVVNE